MSAAGLLVVSAETFVLTLLRSGVFFASRKYLLRNLYHDLQDIASEGQSLLSNVDGDIEMDTLPTPTTATLPNNSSLQALKGTFHSTLSRTLFSLCFSESCTLFALLILQGLDMFHARTRLLNWKISLWLLVAIIVIFIPLAYSLVLSYRSSSGKQTLHRPSVAKIAITALPVVLCLFLLSFVPLPSGLPSSSLWQAVLSRLTVIGTVILGLLSGFGAVSNAWKFLPFNARRGRNELTDNDVRAAEDGLERVRSDLAARQRSIQQLQAEEPEGADSSWFSRVVPKIRGDSELASAVQELKGLEALEYQMSRNLHALKQHREEVKFSRTVTGRLVGWAGRLFAVYCVYRIIMAAVNVIFPARVVSALAPTPEEPSPAQTNTDVLTILLAHALSLFPSVHLSADEVAIVSRQISLALVGVIILSSIRRVLRGVARALRVTSRRLGASLMLLIFAQVMGIYLLSTLVQLRTSFPPLPPPSRPDMQPDIGLVNLFSTLPEFQVFGSVFDSAFLLAAAVSAVTLWFYHRINSIGVVDTS